MIERSGAEYEELFVHKQRETKGLHGYFHSLKEPNPTGETVWVEVHSHNAGELDWPRPRIESKGTLRQSTYLFLLAASAE